MAAKARLMGERILQAREIVEPNRSTFARAIGVDVATIRKIEDGTRVPSLFMLEHICHSLRISFDYVMDGSLNGVDPELAVLLIERYPQLRQRPEPRRESTRTLPRIGLPNWDVEKNSQAA
jgi:transcriptional regulator with XRE-family HTH domain